MSKFTITLMLLLVVCCSFALSASSKKDCDKVVKCKASDRRGNVCPEIYQPVCGYRPGVRCFTTPCTHVTYSNSCEACHDSTVESYTVGKCTVRD